MQSIQHWNRMVWSEWCWQLSCNLFPLSLLPDSLDLTRTMIVFGADINQTNDKGETPRHLAASLKKSTMGEKSDGGASFQCHVVSQEMEDEIVPLGCSITMFQIWNIHWRHLRHLLFRLIWFPGENLVYTLHVAGASRCNASMTFCTDSCHHAKTANGIIWYVLDFT